MNLIQLLHLIEGFFFLKIKITKLRNETLYVFYYYCLGYKNKGNIKAVDLH